MATARQLANLRRGGATADAARKAREAKRQHAAADRRIAQDVQENPEAALAALHADLVLGVRRLTRRWLAAKGDPSRELVSAWTELRRLTTEVLALRRLQDHTDDDAKAFLGQLHQRIEAMAPRLFDAAKPLGE